MKFKSSFLNEAVERGFFYQSTNLEGLDEYLSQAGRFAYTGFDLTAPSLHVGHLIPLFLSRLFRKHGHYPIILLGLGTTLIGDPSFRNTARPMLTHEEIMHNYLMIKDWLQSIFDIDNEEHHLVIMENNSWLKDVNYLQFLRDFGQYFSINRMIGFESVKAKLSDNSSLSFLEFNYMLLQAYDFYNLNKNMHCCIQFGGQDQWGNIICGVELIRKALNTEVFGFTTPLLTTSDGRKMGKTAKGAVWLSKDKLTPYDFWQYWRNVDDADVIKLLYLFTELEVSEIKKMEHVKGKELNELKRLLADEVTSFIHGRESLETIHKTVDGVFSNGADCDAMNSLPRHQISKSELATTSIIDVIVQSGMCDSRGEAKRLVRGGGVYVDGTQVDEEYRFSPDKDKVRLSCGKKKHLLVELC